MARPLTVLPAVGRHEPSPRADLVANIRARGVVTLSGPVTAGTRVIRVENTTDEEFEFKFQRMPPGVTARGFLAQPPESRPGLPWGGLGSVPPRSVVFTTIDFAPGEYVLGTWPPIRHPTSVPISVAEAK